jgi:hypothetical protein
MIAVSFALVAIVFAGSRAAAGSSLRAIAMALLLSSLLAMHREFRVYQLSWRDMPDEEKEGGLGSFLAIGALVSMVPSPVLAGAVVSGAFPARAAFLYELAVLSHLLVAILLLLHAVWRNFALRPGAPSA